MSATELPGNGFEEFWTATPDTIKLMASSNLSFHVWKAARAPLLRALQANVDLAAESERLRAALEDIADMTFDPWTNGFTAGEIARAALKEAP